MFNLTKVKRLNNKGFTLVEMLVSLTLLSVVIVIAMGLLLTANANVKQSSTQRRVIDNLNFALEHMSRSISYGTEFSCIRGGLPMSCDYSSGGTQFITFKGKYLGLNTQISYERSVDPFTGRGSISRTIASGNPVSLTDAKIDVQELTFYVYHADPYSVDPEQPKVIVAIRGVSYASGNPQEFFVQTTLSQRDLKL
jgi:prepilin-type N-terminal cleavage/methylation domain-containing protein